jgi:hypothetical protein
MLLFGVTILATILQMSDIPEGLMNYSVQGNTFTVFSLQENIGQVVSYMNLVKRAGYVMHQQFNVQQLYALPTLYLCVLHLSENKHQLVPLAA